MKPESGAQGAESGDAKPAASSRRGTLGLLSDVVRATRREKKVWLLPLLIFLLLLAALLLAVSLAGPLAPFLYPLM